jgi:myosin heavy subunit
MTEIVPHVSRHQRKPSEPTHAIFLTRVSLPNPYKTDFDVSKRQRSLTKSYSSFLVKRPAIAYHNFTKPGIKEMARTQKVLNWQKFLSRKKNLGNFASRSIPSKLLQEKIEVVENRIDSDINSTEDSVFPRSIKKIDRSINIEGQLKEISTFTLAKKEIFNELHDQCLAKEEKLENLKKVLTELEETYSESRELENTLVQKKGDLAKTKKDLVFENCYTETLRYMIQRSRDMVKKAAIPINSKNDELFKIKLEVKKEQRDKNQLLLESKQIKKKYKKINSDLNREKEEKNGSLDFKLKTYEEQQRLKKYIEIEHKRNENIERNKMNVKRLQEMESKIAELKQENMIDKELTKLTRHLEIQERKFKAIQNVTKSSSVNDILPYYHYLENSRDYLEKCRSDHSSEIESLTAERDHLLATYKSLFLQQSADLTFRSQSSVSELSANLKQEESDLQKKEEEVILFDSLLLSSVNILSRLLFQLSEDESLTVRLDNIIYSLGFCCIKIEKIMSVIEGHQNVYYIESVNTANNYKKPPSFLRLSASSPKSNSKSKL